jgi:hypothetical protein
VREVATQFVELRIHRDAGKSPHRADLGCALQRASDRLRCFPAQRFRPLQALVEILYIEERALRRVARLLPQAGRRLPVDICGDERFQHAPNLGRLSRKVAGRRCPQWAPLLKVVFAGHVHFIRWSFR